eukprot:CAMPEP_0185807866 /NCGR_PEP_ID=MMETSP1322-20130828/5267_1 /TAXON_ID=265543 /ORGANISM="Minutocellus polymorphus, Strain RCC2270" /LENGTH=1399 /DNA_ID=CAMNT_0028504049 /DNA_START=527 /DNA_END=4726 /DNA_ORIENTATION=+
MSPSGSKNGDNLPRPGGHSRSSSDDAPPNVDDRSDRVASSGGAPPPPALADSPPKSPSKPPLPPGVSRRGHPLRKGSLGDESVASAISAMSEEEMQQQQQLAENQKTVTHRNIQKPKGAHKRNVSWSHDAPPSTGSVALQQPDLTGEHGGGTGGGAMNGIGGGGGGGPTGPLPPALKPKLQVQRNKTMDSLISNLSPDPRGPGHVRTNTRITLTDLTSNPLEDEAENAIIRALEAREWEQNNPLNENLELERALQGNNVPLASVVDSAEKTGILTGISDQALKMVMEDEQEAAAAAGVMAGVAAAASSNSLVDLEDDSKGRPNLTVSTATAPKPPRSPPRSPKRSPMASSKEMKFEDLAAQLKNAQTGVGLRGRANTSTSAGTGGYLLKAAAAYKAAQSTRDLGDGTIQTAGSKDNTGQQLDQSTPSTRLKQLNSSDSDSDNDPISAGDMMVKNMNKMLGLPNSHKNEEEEARKYQEEREQRLRKESDSYDVEAQQPPSPKPTASSRWAMVREHVKNEATSTEAVDAFKPAAADGAAAKKAAAAPDAFEDEPNNGRGSPSGSVSKKHGNGRSCLSRLPCYDFYHSFAKKCSVIYADISSTLKLKKMIKYSAGLIFLALFISAVLFFVAGNPMTGTKNERNANPLVYASYSWWVNFIGARQLCTLVLSRFTEILMVDVLTLRTRTVLKIFGPFVSLLVIQARGWPYIVTFWAVWNFAFLQGKHSLAKHWLFYLGPKFFDFEAATDGFTNTTRGVGWFGECNYDLTGNTQNITSPDCNPAGTVTQSDIYFRILVAMLVLGCAVAIKRVALALYQGKQTTAQYGWKLERLIKRMLFVTEIAHLAAEIEENYYLDDGDGPSNNPRRTTDQNKAFDLKRLQQKRSVDDSDSSDDEDDAESKSKSSSQPSPQTSPGRPSNLRESMLRYRANTEDHMSNPTKTSNPDDVSSAGEATLEVPMLGNQRVHSALGDSAKMKLIALIGEWEEPAITVGNKAKTISIQDVLQFRQAVLCMDTKHPFSYAFGPANTRQSCIESAQDVYNRLLLNYPDNPLLTFDTLALITLAKNGEIDEKKARKLIRLFRPSRDGSLTALDFVKSCDKIYKDLRTLRAAISNSSQLDLAFERLINVGFYFVLWLIILTIVKLDPWTLFLSLSGFILSFSFCFGSAASKMCEGILLILVQKPYDIGDRIHISNSQSDPNSNGSATWFVEAINLFSTTVRYAATNEVATHSNGSLAQSRIINAARSPKANVYIYNKFASDVPYDRVMLFKSVVESFVKERPREWIALSGFRATRVEADLGYIEYVIALQHVEKWQNIGPILNSKAEVASYCLEVQKKLGMRYEAPPLPVNLGINRAQQMEQSVFEREQSGDSSDGGLGAIAGAGPDFSMLATLFAKPSEAKKTR